MLLSNTAALAAQNAFIKKDNGNGWQHVTESSLRVAKSLQRQIGRDHFRAFSDFEWAV